MYIYERTAMLNEKRRQAKKEEEREKQERAHLEKFLENKIAFRKLSKSEQEKELDIQECKKIKCMYEEKEALKDISKSLTGISDFQISALKNIRIIAFTCCVFLFMTVINIIVIGYYFYRYNVYILLK